MHVCIIILHTSQHTEPVVQFLQTLYVATEGGEIDTLLLVLVVSPPSSQPIVVEFELEPGTAQGQCYNNIVRPSSI